IPEVNDACAEHP
ncbi:hypothetical protein XELAEV_180380583mg, partial [Xenopus laevis]